jgi:hypothetical protein
MESESSDFWLEKLRVQTIFRAAQLPRGFVTFEASKVTKNACQQKGFFALQIRQNHGLHLSAPLRSRNPMLQRKFAMPLQRTRLPLFCLISSEAVLLTGKSLT